MRKTLQEVYDVLVKASGDGTFPSASIRFTMCGETHRPYVVCSLRQNETPLCPQKCAIGVFIPDEKYYPEMEVTWLENLYNGILSSILPSELDKDDLHAIQQCHDDNIGYNLINENCEINWDRKGFLSDLNQLKCFAKVSKVDPELV